MTQLPPKPIRVLAEEVRGAMTFSFLLVACLYLAGAPVAWGGPRFLARTWQSEDGLPSNVVRAVAQATDGYLWVGTPEGVVRFDGVRFTAPRTAGEKLMARRSIRGLFALANGEVWVTTTNGALLRGNGATLEEVALPTPKDGLPILPVSHVVLGESGKIFAARQTEVWQVAPAQPILLAQQTAELNDLLRRDAAAQAECGRTISGESGVRLRGRRGELWSFSEGSRLTMTSAFGGAEPVILPEEQPTIVQAMLEDHEGNLWLGTRTQGLWRLRSRRVEVLTQKDGLSDRTTLLLQEDRTGALWVAPQSGGLDRLHDGKSEHFDVGPPVAARGISALLETRAGAMWAATNEGQVYVQQKGVFVLPFPSGQGPGKIAAMVEDQQGRIWFGGRQGLSSWEGGSATQEPIDLSAAENVTALVAQAASVWAGTESGKVFLMQGKQAQLVASASAFARYQRLHLHGLGSRSHRHLRSTAGWARLHRCPRAHLRRPDHRQCLPARPAPPTSQ